MANLFQCDRCKAIDQPYCKTIRIYTRAINLSEIFSSPAMGNTYDLCESCTDAVVLEILNA